MTLTEAIEATLRKWRSEDAQFEPGASPEEIRLFEQKHGVIMPADLKTYFSTANGMGGTDQWEWDADMISFWPLPTLQGQTNPREGATHVAPLSTVWKSEAAASQDLFAIGDWSIMCFAFCARMTPAHCDTTEIFYFDGGPPLRIATSLLQFLQRYVDLGFRVFDPRNLAED